MGHPDTQVKPVPTGSGAVVVPAADQSILATEGHASKTPLPPIQPQDVDVKVNTQPTIWLQYNLFWVVLLGLLCFAFIAVYCWVLRTPYVIRTVDDKTPTFDSIDSWKFLATLIRTALPPLFTFGIGQVFTVAFVSTQLFHAEQIKWWKRALLVVRLAIPLLFCLPLTGIVVEEQPQQVEPRMVEADTAKYSSLLLPPSSEVSPRNESWYSRTNTTNTILRRSILPPLNQLPHCVVHESQSSNAYTSVAFEFMTNEWQAKMLPVVYLYVDAVLVLDTLLGGSNTAALRQLKLDTIKHYTTKTISNATAMDPTQHIQMYVRDYFFDTNAWATLMRTEVKGISVEYAKFNITPNIDFVAVTVDIPLDNTNWHRELKEVNSELVEQTTTWPGVGDVVYEVDVANECGPKTCGIQNRGVAPEQRVVAYGYCPDDFNCTESTATDKIWLAGFGRRIEGDSFELGGSQTNPKLRKGVVRNVREYHRVTMGRLSYRTESLSDKFRAQCDNASISCEGISFELEPDTDVRQYLVLGDAHVPAREFGASFDLPKNTARGRPLLTRYTTGARIDYEILRPPNFISYVWSPLAGESCSGKMDRSIITTELNHNYMENPLQVTYTAGVFFLFHNARLVNALSADPDNSLAFVGNIWWMDCTLSVPFWQILAGFVDGGLAVIACTFLVYKQYEIISEASRRQFQDPSILVRALVDETNFPRWFFGVKYIKPATTECRSLLSATISVIELDPLEPNNLARGRPLVTRYTTGARVEYEILRPANFDAYVWTPLEREACSGKMENSIITTELNYVYMENPLQATYKAGLFFLFHNAPLVKALSADPDSSLAFIGNTWWMDYTLSVPRWQILYGLGIGIMTVIMLVSIVYNGRVGTASLSMWHFQDLNLLVCALIDQATFPRWFVGIYHVNSATTECRPLLNASIAMMELNPLDPKDDPIVVKLPEILKQGLVQQTKL